MGDLLGPGILIVMYHREWGVLKKLPIAWNHITHDFTFLIFVIFCCLGLISFARKIRDSCVVVVLAAPSDACLKIVITTAAEGIGPNMPTYTDTTERWDNCFVSFSPAVTCYQRILSATPPR